MEMVDSSSDLTAVAEAADEFTFFDGSAQEAFGQQLNVLRRVIILLLFFACNLADNWLGGMKMIYI